MITFVGRLTFKSLLILFDNRISARIFDRVLSMNGNYIELCPFFMINTNYKDLQFFLLSFETKSIIINQEENFQMH